MITEESDPVTSVIFWITIIFSIAIFGRYLAKRFNQPGVLGELLIGVAFGNICYFLDFQFIAILREGSAIFGIMKDMLAGLPLNRAVSHNVLNPYYANQITTALGSLNGLEYLKVGYILDIFSRYGVIFMLFMVGLQSSIKELKETGIESLRVAIIGVILPILFGFMVSKLLLPQTTFQGHLFIAATLSATSIGITARVLAEMKKLQTREAGTILGAAVIDDILGLVILAIVSSMVISNQVNLWNIMQILIYALLFFAIVFSLGPWALKKVIPCLDFLEDWEAKLAISFIFVMTLSWLASLFHLSSIIGAFAAGLIIHDGMFDNNRKRVQSKMDIGQLIAPLESILAPLFFMLIGIQVKLETFFDSQVLIMAIGLVIAAIAGKLLSGLGANKREDRVLIGLGMMPRGEVGLIFASIGRTLGVISDQLFSAIILMVIVTTFITPPALKMRYARN
jgi:Kef-type K+ transport system membrane component KefB